MQVRNISMSEIVPSALNPRKTFDQQELEELAQSIKENGLIQPITLRKTGNSKEAKYEIVCGERRFRACQIIGEKTIQAVVKDLNDKQAFACMIIENLQRKNIDPMEEAAALNHLYTDGSMSIGEMAKMLGKSTSFVSGRIQLHNTIPQFVQLMRDGILVLTHLLDICKLPKEQQEILYESCFTEASRARWTYKFPNIPQLHEMIDHHVMNQLSGARFSLTDTTYACGVACENCPLNTANNPDNARDVSTPRCMKRECFVAKTREAIFREAKEAAKAGSLIVFSGAYTDSEEILNAADKYGLEVIGLGNRQYVIKPTAPDPAMYKDDETYTTRLANYNKVKEVFDDNIKDGTVSAVYELCYDGILSGETKYVYSKPDNNDEPYAGDKVAQSNQRISELKMKLRDANESRDEEFVEKQRAFMESSEYSTLNTELSPTETLVFQALVLKRLPVAFKEAIGCGEATGSDFRSAKDTILANINAIAREFIRAMLSEKSVNYSPELAAMLNVIMQERYAYKSEEIAQNLDAQYNQSKCNIQSKIDALREEIRKEKEAKVESTESEAEPTETSSEASPAEPTSAEQDDVEAPSDNDSEASAEENEE